MFCLHGVHISKSFSQQKKNVRLFARLAAQIRFRVINLLRNRQLQCFLHFLLLIVNVYRLRYFLKDRFVICTIRIWRDIYLYSQRGFPIKLYLFRLKLYLYCGNFQISTWYSLIYKSIIVCLHEISLLVIFKMM